MEIDPQAAGGATAGLMALAVAAWALLRKAAKDVTHIQGEREELAAVRMWRAEAETQRARADKAFEERNAAQGELGALRAEVDFLRRHVDNLEGKVATMQTKIEELLSERGPKS